MSTNDLRKYITLVESQQSGIKEGMELAQALDPAVIQTVQNLRKEIRKKGLPSKLEAKKTMLVIKMEAVDYESPGIRKLIKNTLTQAGIKYKVKYNYIAAARSISNVLIGIPYDQQSPIAQTKTKTQ